MEASLGAFLRIFPLTGAAKPPLTLPASQLVAHYTKLGSPESEAQKRPDDIQHVLVCGKRLGTVLPWGQLFWVGPWAPIAPFTWGETYDAFWGLKLGSAPGVDFLDVPLVK